MLTDSENMPHEAVTNESTRERKSYSVHPAAFVNEDISPTVENISSSVNRDNEDSECKIAILNNDCLAHIFSYLSQRELILIERVCKWWQAISLDCWYTFKRVSTEDIIKGTSSNKWWSADKALECIFKRCGEYVEYLTVDLLYSDLGIISLYCTKLEYLEVSRIDFDAKTPVFGEFSQLRELKVKDSSGDDDEFVKFFKVCPNIRSLYISDTNISGKCLQTSTLKSLDKLTIVNCQRMRMISLIAGFRRMENLKSLTMNANKYQVSLIHFKETIKILSKLEHLAFNNCIKSCHSSLGRYEISKNLISLDTHKNTYITDGLLRKVAKNCVNLETLNISECNRVTHKGIQALAHLPCLKYLYMSNIRELNHWDVVSDYELIKLASRRMLKKLEVKQNSIITDAGCCTVLTFCEELEYFDLSGCSEITDQTVDFAIIALQYRPDDKKLELVVGETNVSNSEKWKNMTPSLILNFNFSGEKWYPKIPSGTCCGFEECHCGNDGSHLWFYYYTKGRDSDFLDSDSDEPIKKKSKKPNFLCGIHTSVKKIWNKLLKQWAA